MQLGYLQEVSDHRYLARLSMRLGIESAVSGFLLGVAIPTILKGSSAIVVLWLLVIALVGHGLLLAVRPYPKGLIVNCFLKCCLGGITIAASFPSGYFVFVRAVVVPWWVLGAAEIAGSLGWAARYKRVSHVSGTVSPEWLNYLDGIVTAVRAAAAAHDPSILEVVQRAPLGTEKLKAQLYPDWAIFVGPGGREALIADRLSFALGPARNGPVKGRVSAEMKCANRTVKMFTTPDAYDRLTEWSNSSAPSLSNTASNRTACLADPGRVTCR
jgi:hypothetical protein